LNDSPRPHPVHCWEWLSCQRDDCRAYQSEDLRCWLAPDSACFKEPLDLTARLSSRCMNCPVFTANRSRSQGKRYSDQAMVDTLDALLLDSGQLAAEVKRLGAESRSKSAQVTLLSEVGRALQSTMEVDQLLLVILTAVTAGDGLGFNRAFLLLVNEMESAIKGRVAVGPADPDEADRIWKAMRDESKSLGQILSKLSYSARGGDKGIMRIAERLDLHLDPSDNLVAACLDGGTSLIVQQADDDPRARSLAGILGNDHFLIVPLVAEGKKLGAILADNFITGRRILPQDVRLLETFASQAALAILNASLHKKLRDRLRQLEQAHEELRLSHLELVRAEASVALGGLAATLVHDLKAPLVSIGLMARATASRLSKRDTTRGSLEKIAEKATEIETYLREMAQSAGRRRAGTEKVDLSLLIKDCLELMRGLILRSGVKQVTRFNHSGGMVQGSRVELRQMFLNLFQNALEAMPHGGTLTVETADQGPMTKILIRDTGQGIPEEAAAKIFSAFFSTKAGGSGLGLFTAKRVARDHGGRIALESEPGSGACFTIMLPSGE
jgi:signal transduction histidine kinase